MPLPLPIALVFLAQPAAPSFRADLDAGRYLKVLADAEARLRQNPGDAAAWAAKSQALSSLQRFAEAHSAADRALAANPRLADALLARGLARAGEAIRQRDLGSLRGALGAMDDLRAATEADPTLAPAWMSLGLAYEMLPGILGGSTRKALRCADQLRRVAPARGDLLQALVLVEEDKWWEAQPYFGRALAQAPQDPEVVGQWLDALDRRPAKKAMGEAGKNARLLAEASRLLPGVRTRARGVAAVSDAYLHGGRPDLAWQVVQDHLAQVDAPSLLHLQLGKVAASSGLHRPEGLAALDQVLREPLEGGAAGYPGAWWRKGQILRDLGRKDEARKAAQEALRLDPKHRGARELLETLEP
ncbi:tetratricopeptide repeat protein [Geothrix terrae]|uniref:tetratricopeptide repeat protein n=1 Tax=Geothrix terrae TaxID=2922720 RepID=UPI001FAC7A5C